MLWSRNLLFAAAVVGLSGLRSVLGLQIHDYSKPTTTTTSRAQFLSASGAALLSTAGFAGECSAATETSFDAAPRTRGILLRRITGDGTPYEFPVVSIPLTKTWPTIPPFTPDDFSRANPENDSTFYNVARFVYHIDEPAVAALTQYYRKNIPQNSDILDICSSWVSHYPTEFPKTMKSIRATGMNVLELQCNDQLTMGYTLGDLNENPTLPYPDNSMDVVTCVVSIDYLIEPIAVLRDVHRILRPGGKIILSQSNRCFKSKAIHMWLQMNDKDHLELINGYLQYAGGFQNVQAFDITARITSDGSSATNDPMYIVEAVKV